MLSSLSQSLTNVKKAVELLVYAVVRRPVTLGERDGGEDHVNDAEDDGA